ncbi:hypothetical protein [Flammeovirga sp. OC4]|uniref:hypothetical protein n=1 Tax=Flammeovirga sp. OC4 TaxID=1382345 RepID=UPI0005C58954|nr:hypothetical protein [Flammeovirga sp. OC4]
MSYEKYNASDKPEEKEWEFELLASVNLNNVHFTLRDTANVSNFLTTLNNAARVFMTPTVFKGKQTIRASFMNWRTNEFDLKIVMEEMRKVVINIDT